MLRYSHHLVRIMATGTRSSQRLASAAAAVKTPNHVDSTAPSTTKRKAPASRESKTKKPKTSESAPILPAVPPALDSEEPPKLIPAKLSFSFDEAKAHLTSVDPRFEDLFQKMKCTPFEVLEQVHPFRSLATSIIGQQISWKAAKSINHKFKRLYDPSLPEDVNEYNDKSQTAFFPSPAQVAATDPAVLRTAGLSGRKGEYIIDLASRFADGRLTTDKLINATDEELAEMLIAVKGIGKWTIDMFAIFTLRRPNIMPVGDLGVQRGVLRWFLSLHSPDYDYALQGDKVTGGEESQEASDTQDAAERATTPDASSVAPAVPSTPKRSTEELPSVMPPHFTPSINKTLRKTQDTDFVPPPLPPGLTAGSMKSRLDTKKKIKGALLTPSEMENLTELWKPYRSLVMPAVYYMWALADG
ncbi:DNA glycosylase [Hymenopellis radicata]|nr:DNA glycosylase [Hymenopellis radicata]